MMAQIGVQETDLVAPEVSAEPAAGAYEDGQEVTLTSSDPDASICYTTDGSDPLPSGNRFSEPIRVDRSVTIKAMAVDTVGYRGPVTPFSYTIAEKLARSTLDMSPSVAALGYGQSATLSGRLTANGAPLPGQRVELQHRPAGTGGFERLGPVDTRPDGTFSLSGVRPQRNTDYRAVFEGDGSDHEASVSPVRRVGVRATVSLNASTRNLKRGRKRTLSGKVGPSHAGKTVRLTIKRNGRVISTRNVRLDRSSRYRFTYRPPSVGTYVVSARFAGDADHLGGTSPTRRFRVVR